MARSVCDPLGTECEECLDLGPFCVGWDELESMARELVSACEEMEDGWNILCALGIFGIRVVEAALPPGERAFYVPDSKMIVVQKGMKASAKLMALLHEFSHAVSERRATHADVHALSLCLAITPQRVDEVRRGAPEPTAQDLHDRKLPVWAAVLRARWLSRVNSK